MELAVLLTYHNEGPLLTETLLSLFAHDLSVKSTIPTEIWIYDDASSIRPEAFVPANLPVRPKFLRSEKNTGPGIGRNRLAAETRARFIHFHDADDPFLPKWGASVERILQGEGPDLLVTELDSYKEGVLFRQRILGLSAEETRKDFLSFCLHHPILPSAATYAREFFLEVGGYDERLWQSEDYELHVRMATQHPKIAILEESLVQLRLRDQSRSRKEIEVWECRLQALKLSQAYLPKTHSLEAAEAAADVACRLFELGATGLSRDAYALTEKLGKPTYRKRHRGFRTLAKTLGPLPAEHLSKLSRSFRQLLRRLAHFLTHPT